MAIVINMDCGKKKWNNLYQVLEGYDVLHTQGSEWLMNDIDEFLRVY